MVALEGTQGWGQFRSGSEICFKRSAFSSASRGCDVARFLREGVRAPFL